MGNQITLKRFSTIFLAGILLGAVAVFSPTQPAHGGFGTILEIEDDNTGGDCDFIGKWNNKTKTCRLTVDLDGGDRIEIGDDDITLNCDDHLLNGTGSGNGISILGSHVTVKNCDVTEFTTGIFVDPDSDSNTIKSNNAFENDIGIKLLETNGNTVKDNTANENEFEGIFLERSIINILAGNNFNNNGEEGIELAVNSDENTLNGNTANDNNLTGIFLDNSDFNLLDGNTANGNDDDGIGLDNSDFNLLDANTANGNDDDAIELRISNNNTLNDNTFHDNFFGIFLIGSDNNTLNDNTSNENVQEGILLSSSNNNTLIGNTANDSVFFHGIILSSSDDNILIGNLAFKNLLDGFILSANSGGNTLEDNEAKNNGDFGFEDRTIGSGTEGTKNFYFDNKCTANGSGKDFGSDPDFLCSPQN